ncbi:hypothetical protein [Longitalea luteola]|uniref:hypothetical protein n=1 Tax=Longitalea luteola TaxID=2812563 RepID=UPI001A9566E8|nr:hypothetical protein [Longitalea luteola]
MIYIYYFLVLTALFSFTLIESIYRQPLKNINGEKIELSHYRGKKMLFVIVPVTALDTTISINDLSSLQEKYSNSLVVFGIPSEDAGFKKGDEEKIKKIYSSKQGNFILTEGMKVKKGAGQSELLQWLTNKEKNRHFDRDVQGVGAKFFVDEMGELYAVMGPRLKLTDPLTDRILSKVEKQNNNKN